MSSVTGPWDAGGASRWQRYRPRLNTPYPLSGLPPCLSQKLENWMRLQLRLHLCLGVCWRACQSTRECQAIGENDLCLLFTAIAYTLVLSCTTAAARPAGKTRPSAAETPGAR